MKIFTLALLLCINVVASKNINRTQLHMGTFITLQTTSNQAINNGFQVFKDLDNKLSTYKPKSEVSQYNQNNQYKLSKETLTLVLKSKNIKIQTNGYFDINYKGKDKLDFGAIAKGYAVDKVAKNWTLSGINSGTISASGDIRCIDICDAYIEDPLVDGKYILHFNSIKPGLSISTSGQSRQKGHLKNPHKHKSTNTFNSLTLFSFNDNTTLDALTTAIYVMPYPEALIYLKNLKNIGWVIVNKKNRLIKSKNILNFIQF